MTGKRQALGFSWNQEVQMGAQADKEIIQQFGLYEDPKVQAYVNQLGQRLVAESDLRGPNADPMYRTNQYTFRVLNSPVVNAFALPGGYVYVTRGLLTHADNEAQLAMVLGHEIGHVAGRHAARQAWKSQWGQIGVAAGAILGGSVLGNSQAAGQLANLAGQGMQLLTLRHSRNDEHEADRLGARYAASEGYDVAQAAGFFRTLKMISQKEGVTIPNWMATHPDPGQRERNILELAKTYTPPNAIRTVGEEELLRNIDGIIMGEDPREGFVQGNTFYHPELGFQFPVPRGWKVNNERAAVMMADPNKQGVMIFELAPAATAREAAQKLASMQGINIVQSGSTRINGQPAQTVVAQANTQQGQVGVLSYFIESGGKVYSFMGLAPVQAFQGKSAEFQQVVTGFDRLRDRRLANVQPARLAVITTDRTAPFTSFLPTSEVAGLTPQDVALMNQVEMTSTIPKGTRLKVPRLGATTPLPRDSVSPLSPLGRDRISRDPLPRDRY